MNTVVLRRRLLYISAMVGLLIPLYFLGHPSVRRTSGEAGESTLRQGGSLAQIRTAYSLHHSDLGELDPASESARLATLGLRGVAATILWQKAEYYKREKYFDRLAATVNQLRILQPHFIKVWEFQAHNLAWNVSVEFDDYRQRYEWVKKGIHFLIDGSKYNKTRTEMPFELGWAFGNKLGMSDEKTQFRELYRNDRNFHNEVENRTGLDLTQAAGQGPDGKPDNWRSGTLWYLESYRMVDAGSRPARQPLMFYCKAPQWQYKHAEAIQEEGFLGEEARNAWKLAGNGWREYGQRQIQTSYGTIIFLNEDQSAKNRYEDLLTEFKELCGDVYTQAYDAKYRDLPAEQRLALEKDLGDRSVDEVHQAEIAETALELDPFALAKDLPEDKQVEAVELASQMRTVRTRIDHINRYREQINYAYWELRCETEQSDDAILARSNMYAAEQLFDLGKLDEAISKYDVAWAAWSRLFNSYPALIFDDEIDEVVQAVERYRSKFVDSPNSQLPEDFPLNDFLDFRFLYAENVSDASLMKVATQWPKRYPERNYLEEMLARHPSKSSTEVGPPPQSTASEAPPEGAPSNEVNDGQVVTEDTEADPNDPQTADSEQLETETPKTDIPETDTPKTDIPETETPETETPETGPELK